MRIAIVTRANEENKWGGDLKAQRALAQGMKELGHDARVVPTPADPFILSADSVFLGTSALDLQSYFHLLKLINKPYNIIPFHEDFTKLFSTSMAFQDRVYDSLKKDTAFSFCIKKDLAPYKKKYAEKARSSIEKNREVFLGADLCIANSLFESATIKKNYPNVLPKITLLPSPIQIQNEAPLLDFLNWTGLTKKEYILQIGRIEPKKNQLATILACKDHPAPLVFIATIQTIGFFYYVESCIAAALKYRKGKTIIISQDLPKQTIGPVQILPMPENNILPYGTIQSAMENAALHIHPSFHELPGYTYLESAYFGVPTIASTWTSIQEYFTDSNGKYLLDDRMEFCAPYDTEKMKELVHKKFGKRYAPNPNAPIFSRTEKDFARDVLNYLTSSN